MTDLIDVLDFLTLTGSFMIIFLCIQLLLKVWNDQPNWTE